MTTVNQRDASITPGGRGISTSTTATNQRRDTCLTHRQQGKSILAAAKAMGIGVRTARRFEQQLKALGHTFEEATA
jgi:transposase